MIPSSYVVFYTNIQLFGLVVGILVNLLYILSAINLLRLIKLCAMTEPGVIPAIPGVQRGLEISKLAANATGLMVKYKSEGERVF